MVSKIVNSRIVTDGYIKEGASLYIKDGRILALTEDELPFDRLIDAEGNYLSSGFIDIHVHGGGGFEFIDGTRAAIEGAVRVHALHGTTTLYPTLSAFDTETTRRALSALREYKNSPEPYPCIFGAHLEGPYFSPSQCGAQDSSYIREPREDEYTALADEYGDLIKRWSYAPELDGADEFLTFLKARGIVAAAGHTDAEYSDMERAFEGGCTLITHLYSCTSTIKRVGGFRRLGVTESAYLIDGLTVEAIADGAHLPPELIKLIFKQKDDSHICLITDAIRFGGMSECEGLAGGTDNVPYIIEDGVAKLSDRSAFAGSIATMDKIVYTCVKKAGIPLPRVIKCATEVPARVMGLSSKGRIAEGFDADIVIFDENIEVKTVIAMGETVNA